MPRNGSYLVRPKGTIYHVRLQYNPYWAKVKGRKVFQISLHTDNLQLAEIRAAKYVLQHKYEVYLERVARSQNTVFGEDQPAFIPGMSFRHGGQRYQTTRDGKSIQVFDAVSDEHITSIENTVIPRVLCPVSDGELRDIERIRASLGPLWNRGITPDSYDHRYDSEITDPLDDHLVFVAADKVPRVAKGDAPAVDPGALKAMLKPLYDERPSIRRKPDDRQDKQLIEHWLKLRGVADANRKQFNAVYNDFTALTGKLLVTATREDAKALVRFYRDDRGLLWSTYDKHVRWLSIVIDAAKDEDFALERNVFRGVTPRPPRYVDGVKNTMIEGVRKSYSTDDVAAIMAFMPQLKPEFQTLVMLVAYTGMRPSEALAITEVIDIDGFLCVEIGKKTNSSERTIPLPEPVHRYLPRLDGPLFIDAPLHNNDLFHRYCNDTTTKLNKRFQKLGMARYVESRKSFYSFRHRAKDMVRNCLAAKELQQWLLGHSRLNAEDNYGDGPPPGVLYDPQRAIWRDIPPVE